MRIYWMNCTNLIPLAPVVRGYLATGHYKDIVMHNLPIDSRHDDTVAMYAETRIEASAMALAWSMTEG